MTCRGSLILSAEMMLRHLAWVEAADLIVESLGAAISDKQVTYDEGTVLARPDVASLGES